MRATLATILTLVLWLLPIYVLYLLPTKMLAILAGICLLSCGIVPIIVFLAFLFATVAIWEALTDAVF